MVLAGNCCCYWWQSLKKIEQNSNLWFSPVASLICSRKFLQALLARKYSTHQTIPPEVICWLVTLYWKIKSLLRISQAWAMPNWSPLVWEYNPPPPNFPHWPELDNKIILFNYPTGKRSILWTRNTAGCSAAGRTVLWIWIVTRTCNKRATNLHH